MSTSSLVATALVAVPALTLAAQDAAERALDDRDLRGLAKELADYIEATVENERVADAKEAVKEEMEDLRRDLDGESLLAHPLDIGRAMWLSRDYSGAPRGGVEEIESRSAAFGKEFEYAVWAPRDYRAKKGPYPFILCIPGEQETPKQHLIERWISDELRDNAILASMPMPEDYARWSETGAQGNPGGVAYVMTTFRDVSERYAIDFDRIYLAGHRAGVATAIEIGEMFGHRFAGVIGRSGDLGSDVRPDNFRNLPTWFMGQGSRVTAFQEGVKQAGYDNCTIDTEGGEEELWAWIQEHPRNSYPTQVTLMPGSPFPTQAFWLRVPPLEGANARVEARADYETNTITIEADGVPSVDLFLNDLLVDLDEPVKVLCNGVEHVDQVPRSVNDTLEFIRLGTSDPGRVYVAVKSYAVTAPSGSDG